MNNTDEITQLNEMLKRVEKLVSNLPETEQMMYQSMIKAKPDSLEHLKTIEQIAQKNIADSVTDHDFDDYIPDTFYSANDKAVIEKEIETDSPVIKDLSRKESAEKILLTIDETQFANVIKRIKEEVAIREKYNHGNFLQSNTKDNDLNKITDSFMDKYLADKDVRRTETHNDCYQTLKSIGIPAGDKSRDIIWYLYKREEDNFRSMSEEGKALAVREASPVEALENLINEYHTVKNSKATANNQKLMGLKDLKELSKKIKSLETKKTAPVMSTDDESFEAFEKEFNEFEGVGQSMEASFGISRMMDRARAEAIFGMDIVKIKDHPSSNQRYFRLQDGSVAKETLDSFQIKTHDIRKNIDTIVAVAKEKGWKKIELSGGRAYIEQMYLAARKEGLLVKPADETQKFLFEQLDKRFKLNEQKQQKIEDDSISIKNVEEDFEVKNASEKKNKP